MFHKVICKENSRPVKRGIAANRNTDNVMRSTNFVSCFAQ